MILFRQSKFAAEQVTWFLSSRFRDGMAIATPFSSVFAEISAAAFVLLTKEEPYECGHERSRAGNRVS
jgi:hypothetical protein